MSAVSSSPTPSHTTPDPQDFLRHLRAVARASEATVVAYGGDIRHFTTWLDETDSSPQLHCVTRGTLFGYIAAFNGLSPNTIRRKIHALGSWFNYLVECEVLTHNPARGLPLPKRQRRLPNYPSPEQSSELLDAARSLLERVVIWLLLTTGLRRGELISLDLDDLCADGTEVRVVGKGNRERAVPLPHRTQQVLADYLQVRGRDPGPLLLNRAGNRLGPTSLRRLFNRLVRRAGVDGHGFTLHSARHAYATMLVQAGVDLGTVRDLLGHADLAVTSFYVHSDLRSKRAGVELLPILRPEGEHNDS